MNSSLMGVRKALGACVLAVMLLLAAHAARSEGYTLDSGDILRVSVLGEASYPLDVVIDDRGSISLPLLGEIQARGLTAAALSQEIANAFRQQKLILEPFVKVEIGQYRPFFISGAVAHPGSYPFQPGITVRQALAIAGGFRPTTAGDTAPALEIADLRSARANLGIEEYRLKVRLARLRVELRQRDSFVAPPDPPIEFGEHLIAEIIDSEQAQLKARLGAFRDELSYLEVSMARAQQEADLIAASRAEREKTAQLQLEELETARTLRQKGLTTNANVMALERAQANYRVDLAQVDLQATQARQQVLNLQSEIRRKRQDHELELISQTQDTQVELGKVQSQIRYVADKLLFLFSYGEQRTFDDLQGSIKILIFRRDRKATNDIVADQDTEVKAGDVIEVSVIASKGFYAPETRHSETTSTPDGEVPDSGQVSVGQ